MFYDNLSELVSQTSLVSPVLLLVCLSLKQNKKKIQKTTFLIFTKGKEEGPYRNTNSFRYKLLIRFSELDFVCLQR